MWKSLDGKPSLSKVMLLAGFFPRMPVKFFRKKILYCLGRTVVLVVLVPFYLPIFPAAQGLSHPLSVRILNLCPSQLLSQAEVEACSCCPQAKTLYCLPTQASNCWRQPLFSLGWYPIRNNGASSLVYSLATGHRAQTPKSTNLGIVKLSFKHAKLIRAFLVSVCI